MAEVLSLVLTMFIKYSYYHPALGGTNCAVFENGTCVSRMASGYAWQPYVGIAAACPPEWAFGTTIELDGKTWICMDRGGKIKFDADGLTYVDFLAIRGAYRHGTLVEITVTPPGYITGGVTKEEEGMLFKMQILSLNNLSSSPVNRTQSNNKISPRLESHRHFGVSQSCVEHVQGYTYCNADKNSNIPFDRSDRNSQLLLEKVSSLSEPIVNESTFHEPVRSDHRSCFGYQKF